MQNVVIVQEVLPDYRVEFFTRLRSELRAQGIELSLLHSSARGARSLHGDEARIRWARHIEAYRLRVGSRSLVWLRVGRGTRRADLVIVEHANRLALNYKLLLHSRLGGPPVAFWGHGANLQGRSTGLLAAWKRYTAALPSWWFAYTSGCAQRVVDAGFPAGRVTVVQNSAPTAPGAVDVPRDPDRLCFVGSLHAQKRVQFLLDAVTAIRESRPSVRVDIVGDGPLRRLVEAYAAAHDGVEYLGRQVGESKAEVVASAVLMLNPGLVGLGVIDSFAHATPMVTLTGSNHSPEFEYLEGGRNAVVLPAPTTALQYAAEVVSVLNSAGQLATLQEGCRASARTYTVEAMVERYAGGVVEFLQSRDRQSTHA